MGYDEDQSAADPENLSRYIDQRADMLRIVLMNHLFWEAALRTAGAEGRLGARWDDHAGQAQITLIDRNFLCAHGKILRSLFIDLSCCGAEGQQAIDVVLRSVTHKPPAEQEAGQPPP